MERTLVIRVPLNEDEAKDIIERIDRDAPNNTILNDLITERFEDVFLTVETGDRVSS